jgi:hypothetical protein
MCCGSRRSAWRSTLAAAPRAAPTPAAAAEPSPPRQDGDVGSAAVFAQTDRFSVSGARPDSSLPRRARVWRLTS